MKFSNLLTSFSAALAALDLPVDNPKFVLIDGGDCYVRTAPGKENKALGVAYEATKLPFGGVIDEDTRWLLVEYTPKGKSAVNGWVSPKYGRLTE